MLRIIQTQSAAGAKNYYSRSDYLSEGQELTGIWHGQGAAMLGLAGAVQKQDFDRMCDNLHPQSGQTLTQRQRTNRTVGYDFNFHVPKGVSLAYELTGDEAILGAFEKAVNETMVDIEKDAATRVRKHGGNLDREVGNLTWAQFTHKTARPVDGTPDPHLHAHCFAFNGVYDLKEDAWKAGQFRDIKRDAPYYEAAYHVRLANNLKELGYGIERQGKTWDLAGISKDLAKKFSRRTEQIEELAREKGLEAGREKDGLGALSREQKNGELGMPELRKLWNERLSDLDRQILHDLKSHTIQEELGEDHQAESKAISHAIEHCFEKASVVPQRRILAEAMKFGVGQVNVEQIHQQAETKLIVNRKIDRRVFSTTQDVIREEQRMLEYVKAGKGNASPLNPIWTLKRQWLNDDQKNALSQILGSTDTVTVLRGSAGTGKTTLMSEAVEAIEATGKQVLTFAPSSEASRGVLAAEGFNATTVAELLKSPKLQAQTANQVIWVDEAGLLSSRQMKAVIDVAERGDARLILSGDWRQHSSPERGNPLKLLEAEHAIQPIRLQEIQRQTGDYKRAVSYLAEGITELGLEELENLGWVHEIADAQQRLETVASDYVQWVSNGKTALVVTPTHREGTQVTDAIREKLKENGRLSSIEHEFNRLIDRRLTSAERADPAMIEPEDLLVFHQNAPGIRRGDRLRATTETVAKTKQLADRYQVFREAKIRLAKGDRIRITHGGKTMDGHRIDNGNLFSIKNFDAEGNIVLNNGWTLSRDFGHIAPGYVSTSHASQGKTVDRVFLVESSESFPAAGREQFYVSVSRGRKAATIYTDNLNELRAAVSRQAEEWSATQLISSDSFEAARRTRLTQMQSALDQSKTQREQERELDHVRS